MPSHPDAVTTGVAQPARVPGYLLMGAALILVLWLFWLGGTLPRHYSARHYALSWLGFDLVLALALGVTGWRVATGRDGVARGAMMAATMLATDAWFDVLQANTVADRLAAVLLAVFVEIPLAWVLWRLARLRPSPADVPAAGEPA